MKRFLIAVTAFGLVVGAHAGGDEVGKYQLLSRQEGSGSTLYRIDTVTGQVRELGIWGDDVHLSWRAIENKQWVPENRKPRIYSGSPLKTETP
jgi:hypothetical protein